MDAGMRDWIGQQFLGCSLGDTRRPRRLAQVAAAFAAGGADASGAFTSVLADPRQSKAAYHLFDRQEVCHKNMIAPHCQMTLEQICRPGTYLLIEDSTVAAFPGLKQAQGLGPIGESYTRGFWLHNTLAVRSNDSARDSEILGLVDQQMWVRTEKPPADRRSNGRGKESSHARQKREDRESARWARGLKQWSAQRSDGACWIYVADRESDIYEVFMTCAQARCSYVIRAAYSRGLADSEEWGQLMPAAQNAPLRGRTTIHVPREDREATLEVRSTAVELRGPERPGGRLPNQRVNVVRVQEVNAPAGREPISWTLVTDLAVQTLEQCLRVVRIYCRRWLIEEFHKALKTGLKLERSQLSDARRLGALAGMLSVISTRLVQMKLLARSEMTTEVKPGQAGVTAVMLTVLAKLYPPRESQTWRWLWYSIAKLGGFMARRGDGPPGWLVLWRGWQRLEARVEGYILATGEKCGER
jgi:hypothetical protein